MSGEYKAKISWAWQDVKSCRQKWSKAKCQEMLAVVGGALEERLTEEGWTILSDLLDIHETEAPKLETKWRNVK